MQTARSRRFAIAQPLFLLEQPRRFLAQYGKKEFRCICQKPRQRHFDAQRVLQHFNAPRGSLAERKYAEAQYISLPGRLLRRDHPSKVTAGAGKARFQTPDSFHLTEMMAD